MIRIAKPDWEEVRQLACDIVNASSVDDAVLVASKKETLMSLLRGLEAKYGPCSKITATVADFTEETEVRRRLYQQALQQAKAEGDRAGERLILESIAEMPEGESG